MKIAIVGAGKLGTWIAESLVGGDHSVTIIDKEESLLTKLDSYIDVMTIAGNGKQISLLQEIDIHTYDYLISTTDRDEKNIVICSLAKSLGCSKTIARVRDPEHMNQIDYLKKVFNIDYITNPDLAITQEIYKYLVEKYTLKGGIFTTGKISLLEFSIDNLSRSIGKTISEIQNLIGEPKIIALSRNGKIIVLAPELKLMEDDTLYVIGEKTLIENLGNVVLDKGKYTDLQKVMIAGGGKTGFYLAKMLSEFNVSVKLIEINKARCQYLSMNLDDVLILNGDATDVDLLEEENFSEMDAFVSVTGYDEDNLLLALMAKQQKIEDVIAKVSRDSYSQLIENMGVDMALNPVDISASYILKYILGSRRVLSSQLIQGQAELLEVFVDNNMRCVDQKIKNLDLHKGLSIVAIQRDSEVIIPDENTVIKDGDRMNVFVLLTDVDDLEKLLRMRKTGLF